MKKLNSLIVLVVFLAMTSGLANAAVNQKNTATIDFETVGQDWTWTLFENGDNAPALYSVVANPVTTGINTSANVAKYIVNSNGQPWAGLWSSNLGTVTFTADNCLVKVMVYKTVISDFDVKFENDNASVNFEKKVSNTKINEWEELTFDFSAYIGTTVTKLVIIPDFPAARTAGSTNYWDNISFGSKTVTPPSTPTVAAADPLFSANKVISMFSDAYTNVPVSTWRTDWSNGSILTDVQIGTNNVKKYSNLNFVGIETTGLNMLDLTAMNKFHIDLWTADATEFKIKLVDFGANGVWNGGGDDVEHELAFTPVKSSWNSLMIPLSDFTNLTTKGHFAQLIFSGTAGSTVYVDNIYFLNDVTSTVNISGAKDVNCIYQSNTGRLSMEAGNNIHKVMIRNILGQVVLQSDFNSNSVSMDLNQLNNGNYLVTSQLENGAEATFKIVK